MSCLESEIIISLLPPGTDYTKDPVYKYHLQVCPTCGGHPDMVVRADRFVKKNNKIGYWAKFIAFR